jgi:hypothetical protein
MDALSEEGNDYVDKLGPFSATDIDILNSGALELDSFLWSPTFNILIAVFSL